MFYYDNREYDKMYVNEDGVYLSRTISDGTEYVRKIPSVSEFDNIRVSSDLSAQGIEKLYANMDDFENVIHTLYKTINRSSETNH